MSVGSLLAPIRTRAATIISELFQILKSLSASMLSNIAVRLI